jgi:hypothetical protein
LPTLIAEPSTEAVYDYLGAADRELLISDFAAAEVVSALSRLVCRTRNLPHLGVSLGANFGFESTLATI